MASIDRENKYNQQRFKNRGYRNDEDDDLYEMHQILKESEYGTGPSKQNDRYNYVF